MGRACQWLLLSRLMPPRNCPKDFENPQDNCDERLERPAFQVVVLIASNDNIADDNIKSISCMCSSWESILFINVRQWLNRHIKPTNWEVESPKPSRCSYLIWLCSSGYCITKTAWQGVRPTRATEVQNKSPFVEITGKLLIVVLQSGSSAGKKKNWTQPRRFLLRRAYDARIVKIKMRRMRGRKVEIGWGAGTVVVEGGGFN